MKKLALATALALSLAGCGTPEPRVVVTPSPSPVVVTDPKREAEFQVYQCLYAAMSAYPNVPEDQMALDVVDACKDVSERDKAALRDITAKFVNEANYRARK